MRKKKLLLGLLAVVIAGALLFQVPAIKGRLLWGSIQVGAYVRGVIDPAGAIPTPLPTVVSTLPKPITESTPTSTPPPVEQTPSGDSIAPTETPALPTATPIPAQVYLEPPEWERQDINGCGPATLSMYLNYYGWEGNQHTIDEVIKPDRADRNVNVEELAYFTWNYAGWLNLIYRVGGEVDTLKALIAAGIPVMIEEGDELAESYWPDDDRWAGHFLLLTRKKP